MKKDASLTKLTKRGVLILTLEVALIKAIKDSGLIFEVAKAKSIKSIQGLIESLYSLGLIDDDSFRELMLDLADIANLDGEELKKKARELEEKILSSIKPRLSFGDEALLAKLHERIESLYSLGLIDDDSFRELMLDLADIANLDGEELKKKARELEEKIERITNERRSGGTNH